MTGELIEFQDTPALRAKLAEYIRAHCQFPSPTTETFTHKRNLGDHLHECHQIAKRGADGILALLTSAQKPVLDLDLHEQLDGLRTTIADHRPALHIVAKYARCHPGDISEIGHDAADFRARGGRYIEPLGIWIITNPTSLTPSACHPENVHQETLLP